MDDMIWSMGRVDNVVGVRVLPKYYPTLANAFSSIVLNVLIDTGKSPYLSEVVNDSGLASQIDRSAPVGAFLQWLYRLICRAYRNEYVYKNALANKMLLGRHFLDTSCILTELRVGDCKADVVVLNGTSTVYEIKSEYDSFERLQSQLASYTRMFDMVNVITSTSQLRKLKEVLPPEVGVMELTHENTVKTISEPTSLKERVDPSLIFGSLTKPEYLHIIKKTYGYVPDVPNIRIYAECLALFSELPPGVAHDEMVGVLSQRPNKRILREVIQNVPSSLRAYVIGSKWDQKRARRLDGLLRMRLAEILAE